MTRPLPVDRLRFDIIEADDINNIAQVVNELGDLVDQVEDDIYATVVEVVDEIDVAGLILTRPVYEQRSMAMEWTWPHNLGYDPIVVVVRDDPTQVIIGFDLAYSVDHNSLTVGFSQAITGRIIASN